MKITKSKLRQIIKEEFDDEFEEEFTIEKKIEFLMKSGNPDNIKQALEFLKIFPNLRDKIDLRGFNFREINLSGFDFTGVNLAGIYLTGADLSNANLTNANLAGTYLRTANLSGADLTGTNIQNAYYPEAATYNETTKFPQGFDVKTHKTDLEYVKSLTSK
jgi:hypothetical protein